MLDKIQRPHPGRAPRRSPEGPRSPGRGRRALFPDGLDLGDEIAESDANPVLVYEVGKGVKVVDARIILEKNRQRSLRDVVLLDQVVRIV